MVVLHVEGLMMMILMQWRIQEFGMGEVDSGASIPIPSGRSLRPVKNRGERNFLMRVFTEIYDSLRCNIRSSLPLLIITYLL